MENAREHEILRALGVKHSDDVWLTHVKTGPTWTAARGQLLQLDGLAMKKSWVSPMLTGYEVKVSRSDFSRDDKWLGYLPFCNRFYIACPAGLITADDLPGEVGLVWYKHGRIVSRKIAPMRVIEVSAAMLYYLLMSRVDSDRYPFFKSRAEHARAYLEERKTRQHLGRVFGTALAKRVEELEEEREQRQAEIERGRQVQETLLRAKRLAREHGVHDWHSDEKWLQALEERLKRGAGAYNVQQAYQLAGSLVKALEPIAKATDGV